MAKRSCSGDGTEVQIDSGDETKADLGLEGANVISTSGAWRGRSMGLRLGLVLCPLCGLQYYRRKRKAVL